MGRYAVPVLGLAMGGILLYASIEDCGWVLSVEPAEYCGDSAVARVVQILGSGITLGAAAALLLVTLGADMVCRRWFKKATARLSAARGSGPDDSRRPAA